MALPKAKAEVTQQYMDVLPEDPGTGWLARARNAARARWSEAGLPVRRDEYWRYTDPRGYTDVDPAFASSSAATDLFAGIDAVTLTFVDGVFDPAQSDDLDLAGARLDLLSQAGAVDIHWAQDLLGHLETNGQAPVARPLAALTTQMASEGVLIHVTGNAAKPLRLRYVSGGGQPSMQQVVKLDPGASLTILEEGLPGARSSVTLEADVAKGAALNHIRVQGPEREQQAMTHLFARIGEESQFKSFTLTGHGTLTRNEAILDIVGDNAVAHVAGAALGEGTFHHDDTVFVTHDAVGCESRQVFKKVLRDGAVGVFQGKILVKEGAQKTDGYQISQSL
ncbi:MAG: SufD family Fe-S cluster assembly protein, partial [Pseudomonadota bacterium]